MSLADAAPDTILADPAPPAAFYRRPLGEREVTIVSDGSYLATIEARDMRNVPFEEYLAALKSANLSTERVRRVFNPVAIRSTRRTTLIDCGNSQFLSESTGQFAKNLRASGIDPRSVDAIVFTHLHPDHIGGLYSRDREMVFPNAELKVPRKEWEYWFSDEQMLRAPDSSAWPSSLLSVADMFPIIRRTFQDLHDRVTLTDDEQEVEPGITAVSTYGHSEGHTSYVVESGGSALCVLGDVSANLVTTLRHPYWHAAADADGPMAEAARRKIFEMLIAEDMPVSAYHFPFPGIGRIEREGDGYRLIPE
jgi:glyoxylase-like metal-dependent hydrolase (beta-lactamase superfamily II)